MKKKLKVKKAALGNFIGRRPSGPINTFNSTPFPRGPINPVRPGMQLGGGQPQPSPGFGLGPRPNNLGSMQGVGDPRLGAPMIPGNQAQMMMRGPQQAAPAQPVPAMKKGGMSKKKMQDGGMVRGSGAAIKGLKKVRIY
jgi:hypothetical protein